MVNKKFLLGILVMMLVFGMTVVGCDTGDDSDNGNGGSGGSKTDSALNGTWVRDDGPYEIIFNNGNFEFSQTSGTYIGPVSKGTYTTIGEIYYEQITHMHGGMYSTSGLESRWYSYNEFLEKMRQNNPNYPDTNHPEYVTTYSVSGNTLTFIGKYEDGRTFTIVNTRK